MGFLMNALGLSERRSCRIVGLSRSVQQYQPEFHQERYCRPLRTWVIFDADPVPLGVNNPRRSTAKISVREGRLVQG